MKKRGLFLGLVTYLIVATLDRIAFLCGLGLGAVVGAVWMAWMMGR